jgi:TolB-like protein
MSDLRAHLQAALGERYRILQELGGGGLSRVFAADEIAPPRAVVIKVLPPEFTSAVSSLRFAREIALVAGLQHPHIVPLLASGTASGVAFFTMPFVEGETLRARLADNARRPIAEVIRLMREVAEALDYAHAHGVVHRDIKPANILLSGGHACVTDFGIAKAVREAAGDASTTTIGMALGTPAYMAPEQAAADPSIDHRADLYALGIVAYEMLAGTTPFAGRRAALQLAAQATEKPRPVHELREDCPKALSTIVMRCLEKDPDARPQDAMDVIRSLDALSTSGATAATPRRSRRRRLFAYASAALLIILGGAIAFVPGEQRAAALTLLTRRNASLVHSRVFVAPLDNQTGDTTLDALGVMAADWVGQALARVPGTEVVDARTALATQEVINHIPWPFRTRDQARAMAQEVGAETLIEGSFYRDGDSLAFQSRIVDVRTGRLVHSLSPVHGVRTAPSRLIAELQQHITASLALASDTTAGTLPSSFSEPPSLEAYQEVYRGVEAFFRADDSSEYAHLERAARLDTNYTTPLVFLAFGRIYNNEYATADTMARRAEKRSDHLAPAERALLDHVEAVIECRANDAVHAAERFMTLMPGSQESPLLLASISLSTHRPRLALRALEKVDPDRGLNLSGPFYWIYQADASAQLGNWTRSLEVSRAGVRRFPDWSLMYYFEGRALARLGRIPEMEQVISVAPSRGDLLVGQARIALQVWGELRAAGHADASDRLIHHYADLLDAKRADTSSYSRYVRSCVLWRAGRMAEARELLLALVASDTGQQHLLDLAQLGIIQAKRGDRVGALKIEGELANATPRYERGAPEILRAEVAAALGERDRAILLIREGIALGLGLTNLGSSLWGNEDMEPLYGYPPFEQLIAPVG